MLSFHWLNPSYFAGNLWRSFYSIPYFSLLLILLLKSASCVLAVLRLTSLPNPLDQTSNHESTEQRGSGKDHRENFHLVHICGQSSCLFDKGAHRRVRNALSLFSIWSKSCIRFFRCQQNVYSVTAIKISRLHGS